MESLKQLMLIFGWNTDVAIANFKDSAIARLTRTCGGKPYFWGIGNGESVIGIPYSINI